MKLLTTIFVVGYLIVLIVGWLMAVPKRDRMVGSFRLNTNQFYQASLLKPGQREIAEAYFRLGVATCDRITMQHQIKGEPIPSGYALFEECVKHEIENADGKSLLQWPPILPR